MATRPGGGTASQAFSRSPFSTMHSLQRTSFLSSRSGCLLLGASIPPHNRTVFCTAGSCRPVPHTSVQTGSSPGAKLTPLPRLKFS